MNEDTKAAINPAVNDPCLLLVSGNKKNASGLSDKDHEKEYVKKLANAILQVFYKHNVARLRCVGAAALNNATKAYIIAKGEAQKKGDKLIVEESFTTVNFDGSEKTGIIKEIRKEGVPVA